MVWHLAFSQLFREQVSKLESFEKTRVSADFDRVERALNLLDQNKHQYCHMKLFCKVESTNLNIFYIINRDKNEILVRKIKKDL